MKINGIPSIKLRCLVLCLIICIVANIPILPPKIATVKSVFSLILRLPFIAERLSRIVIATAKTFIKTRQKIKNFINIQSTPRGDFLKYKRLIPISLLLITLIGVVAISSKKGIKTPETVSASTSDSVFTSTDDTAVNSEMRGVWISYMELSMENESDKSEKAFREKFEKIAKKCKDNKLNTLVVQVRPFCDALYKSKYFPWSHILTGLQGEDPNYDPLEIMCDISDKYSLSLHAWVNPYRVSSAKSPSKLSDNNPYRADNSLGFATENGIYLDPSNEEVRKLIIDGVVEIATNYDVDAIQFDDYFYPPDMGNQDETQYKAYVEEVGESNSMSIDNWRKANVNLLIANTYRSLHNLNRTVKFGVSPQGNIDNNKGLYADVRSWCTCVGFVDYICPQIYFSLENPALGFEEALNSWCELEFADSVELYIGLAGYKAGTDNDENTWLKSDDTLAKEYEIIKRNKKAKGFMLYSYNSIVEQTSQNEINNLLNSLN